MKITTKGIRKQQITRNELVYLSTFVGKLLMPRMYKKLELEITFSDLSGSAYAYCHSYDDDPQRFFEIEMQEKLTRRHHISLMCHELVHVKQYARGELKHLSRDTRDSFMGVRYCPQKTDYWDQPWEIEAFGREVGLATRYFDHIEEQPELLKKFLK